MPGRSDALSLQLNGYRLALAEILYRMPDHPNLLQTFTWQHYDIAPGYPELRKFLTFWEKNIEGRLVGVRIERTKLISATDWGNGLELSLH